MIKIEDLDMQGVSDETKMFMADVIEKLNENNAVEPCDLCGIRMLLTSYEMYRTASKRLIEEGPFTTDKKGNKTVNEANSVTKTYYFQLIQLMKEFGLTVKSRERIKALTPEVDQNNEIMNLLKKREEDIEVR